MVDYENVHSRLVSWLKILLPLLALAILSTLFMVSRSINPDAAIPYAEVDVEELAREPRLTAAEYSGVTSDGAAVTITATSARPDQTDSGGVTAEGLQATMNMPGGLTTDLAAENGVIDTTADTLTLEGAVQLNTSTGYALRTGRVISALGRTEVIADGPVTTDAPYGTLQSGGLVLRPAEGDAAGYVLVFNDGVKLVYQPED